MNPFFKKVGDQFAPEAVNAPKSMRKPEKGPSRFQLYHPASGRFWWLHPGITRIGRGLDNDIVLTDVSVSRCHAKIRVEGSSLYIEDLGSSNGTHVGGEKIKSRMLLLENPFSLGKVDLLIRRPSIFENGAAPWKDTWD